MTKTIVTSYTTFLCLTLILTGLPVAHASEVTGTLSSNTANTLETSGSIGGTVSSSGGGGSSGGGSRSSGSVTSAPSGAVLGAATNSTQTPRFPNAGVAPKETPAKMTLWSALVAFFTNNKSF